MQYITILQYTLKKKNHFSSEDGIFQINVHLKNLEFLQADKITALLSYLSTSSL